MQKKSGKKQSSLLTFSDKMYAHRCFNNVNLAYKLVKLFDLYDQRKLRIKDKELKADIELCMTTLPEIPHFRKTYLKYTKNEKKQRQIYKSHFQEQIAKIDSVLCRKPLYIRLDFTSYEKIPAKQDIESLPQYYEDIGHAARELKATRRLPGLRFYAYGSSWSLPPIVLVDSSINEKQMRSLLTNALFDHIQRVILGDNHRYKRCAWNECRAWFLSTDGAHKFHKNKCRFAHWDSIPANKEKRSSYGLNKKS